MSKQPEALRLAAELEVPVFDRWLSRDREIAAELRRMHASLVAGGFTDEGGELWKPPLGPSALPLVERLEKQRAMIEELREALRRALDLSQYWFGREDRRDYSETDYRAWLALGYMSNAYTNGRAVLAKAEAQG